MVRRISAVQIAALALTALLGVSIVGDVFDSSRICVWGFNGAPRKDDKTLVNAVEPHSSADVHGIRPGDIVSIAAPNVLTRLEAQSPWPGDQLRFFVSSPTGNTARAVTLTAAPLNDIRSPARVLAMIERLLFVLFGLLFLIRRWDSAAGRALGTFLIFFAFGDSTNGGHWLGRISWARIPIFWSAQTWAYVNAVRFACLFPTPDAYGVRAWIYRLTPWYGGAIAGSFLLVSLMQLAFGSYFGAWWRFAALTNIYFAVAIVIALYFAYKSAKGVDRQRLTWVAGAIVFGLGPTFVDFMLVPFRHVTQVGGGAATRSLQLMVDAVTQTLLPVGFAYAILKHHVLDIRFIVNRALVLGLVSAIIFAPFALAEWIASRYLETNTWTANAAVSAIMVLVIAASLRSIHQHAKRAVNDLFFRARKNRLAALDAFARQSAFYSDARVLESRALEVLARDACVPESALYLSSGDDYELICSSFAGPAATIGRNDEVVIALQEKRVGVQLEGTFSNVPGVIALPMFARGKLLGLMSCSRKADGTPSDPDELSAIARVVQAVGTSIDGLHVDELQRLLDESKRRRRRSPRAREDPAPTREKARPP